MYVPNYVPEPLEVPGNVTQERYPLRLVFIRRVVALHFLSVGAVAASTWVAFPRVGWLPTTVLLALSLVGLDLLRIFCRGQMVEARLSARFAPVLVLLAGWAAREAIAAGFPAWALAAGPAAMLLYTAVCRQDFSFVGGFVLSLIASSVAVAWVAIAAGTEGTRAAVALVANAAFLFYYVYDLASLLARRRRGEELAAVVDLYRDVFNVFGYVPRVISHWRKHKIWGEVRKRP